MRRMKRFHWLEQEIKRRKFTCGVEVGTGVGVTARHLFRTCRPLHLIQVAYYPDCGGPMNSTMEAKRLWKERISPFLSRATIIEKTSLEAVQEVKDESMDFVFIDADHSYQCVVEDIIAWYPKVRKGGLLCGHDYKHPELPGVQQAVDELFFDSVIGYWKYDHVWFYEKGNDDA